MLASYSKDSAVIEEQELPASHPRSRPVHHCLSGGGEMGALMRSIDWSLTALGPLAAWPPSLRTSVSICLASRFPILLWWGQELVMLYNDAYRPILGTTKHPASMGQRGGECWPEIWDLIGPMLRGVLEHGDATRSEDQLLLDRNGYIEECYFTFSYSPIRDDFGRVEGVFTAVFETTERVLGERRSQALKELAAQSLNARSTEGACEIAACILRSNSRDIPFFSIYVTGGAGEHPHLAATSLDGVAQPAWPLDEIMAGGRERFLPDLKQTYGNLPGGAWPDAPDSALVLPLAASGQTHAAGYLVLGISPRLAFDDAYRTFFHLAATQVGTAIANAQAYESERERAESLAELDRAKTLFFNNISHEFRTPLTLLLGPIEELLGQPGSHLDAGQRDQLQLAHRNALRLLRLVNTLLDFSRMEAGRTQAVFEPLDLGSITADIVSVFRSAVERAGLTFTVDCPPLSEPVYADRQAWEQIVLNLVSNAFKFTLRGGIRVVLRVKECSVELRVEDTGEGIPAAELPRIFDRFHRVEGALGRTFEGSGIGLALVRDLVQMHGGTVEASSEPGKGSVFSVTLRRGRAHLPADRIGVGSQTSQVRAEAYVDGFLDAQTTAVQPGGRRILLADDNADMRTYVSRLLGGRYNVQAVEDGEAALAAALVDPPDLILSDVMMPKLDGFGLLAAVRGHESLSGVPFLMLSARAGEESAVEGMHAGADDYLVKPFTQGELLARVEAHLRAVDLRREKLESEARLCADAEAARAKLVAALRASGICTFRLDRETGRIEWEGETERLFGGNFAPAVAELQSVLQAAATRTEFESEFRIVTGSGAVRWFGVRGNSSPAGPITGVVADFTERRQAEERARSMMEASPVPMLLHSVAGEMVEVNRAFTEMTGFTIDDIPNGHEWFRKGRRIPEDQIEAMLEETHRGLLSGPPAPREVTVWTKSGERREWFFQGSRPIAQAGGAPLVVSAATDITERKQTAESLRESERLLRRLVDSNIIGIAFCDAEQFTDANDVFLEMVGYSREDLRARRLNWRAMTPRRYAALDDRAVRESMLRGACPPFEKEYIRKDGGLVPVLVGPVLLSPVQQSGAPEWVCFVVDLSQQKAVEKELQQSNEDLQRFAYAASHDLQEPLRMVTSYGELLLRRNRDILDEDSREYVRFMMEGSRRMRSLIQDLLDYSQLAHGRGDAACRTDSAAVLQLALMHLKPAIDEAGARITYDNLPVVEASDGRLLQIYQNLIGNAIKYRSQEPLSVHISAQAGPEFCTFSVRDNGIGIAPAYHERIFGVFQRLHARSEYEGTGIGLAIVKRILERFGGRVWVESDLGKGSTFYFTLPMS